MKYPPAPRRPESASIEANWLPAAMGNRLPTIYNGTTFELPLAARWAVFFDAMGILWAYQSNAFEYDGRRVVPDFWLPHYECFWEVRSTEKLDYDRYGTWAAIVNRPVVISNRLPHYCGALTPARLVVIGFPCAEPLPWSGSGPEPPTPTLRQRIAQLTGRTWIYSESRIPGECPGCEHPVLLHFDADPNQVACPLCQWCGFPAPLMGRYGVAGDAAEAYRF